MTVITRRQQQRNLYQHSLISNLPREVLSLVFLELKAIAASDTNIEIQALTIKDWICVSHVCHAWKAIALACLELWTSIYVTPVVFKWASEFFHRSRGQPFDLYVSIPFYSVSDDARKRRNAVLLFLEKTVLKNMPRCRNVVLNELEPPIACRLLSSATPSTLRSVGIDSIDWEGPEEGQPVLPNEVATLRCINKLAMTWCSSRSNLGELPNLTHLELRHVDCIDPDVDGRNHWRLLKALSDLPLLRHAVLFSDSGAYRYDEPNTPPDLPPSKLRFDALQYFELVGDFYRVYDILRGVLISQSCNLSIEACDLPSSWADGTAVLDSMIEAICACRSLPTAPRSAHDEPSHTARIVLNPVTNQMVLQTLSAQEAFSSPRFVNSRATLHGHPNFLLRFGYRRSGRNPLEVLPLLGLLEPSHIKALEIVVSTDHCWSHYTASQIDIQQHLDILLNDLEDPSDIKSGPKCTCKATGPNCTWTPRFPALETIDIRRADNTFILKLDPEFVRRLRVSLGRRSKHGFPSPRLRLPSEFNRVSQAGPGSCQKLRICGSIL